MAETSTRPAASSTNRSATKWLSAIAALVGAWIAISPFVLTSTDTAIWNNLIVGAAILVIAGYNYFRVMNDQSSLYGAMAFVALLGIWIVIAPFAFEIGSDELLWSNVAAGVLALIFAGIVANAGRRLRAGAPEAAE